MIMEHIKKNIKTKQGRRLLFIEGIVVMIGASVLLVFTPKEITISGHLGLLGIAYVIGSLYLIVRKYTYKSLDNKDGKE